jgi:catechol 2,3-dioxygenase-like lactoylglutathione lyase family enzyme
MLLLMAAALQTALLGQPASTDHAVQVGAVVMTVSDMDRAVAFYSQLLAFQKISDSERSGPEIDRLYGVRHLHLRAVDLKLGDETIELLRFGGAPCAPIPSDARSNDLSFQHVAIIVSDMDAAYQVLRSAHVEQISSFPQRLPEWNPNAAGIQAFYFKDPDGHPLEILLFPPDKGDRKWHLANGKLFLGIDHTAIVVSNTDASLKFYHDLLGMRVAGESDNFGIEQEHLNGIFGAHLRITAMRSQSGIGIEFLEYITPRDGRRVSESSSPSDPAHHETVIAVDDLDEFNAALNKSHDSVGRVKPMDVSGLSFGADNAEMVRDPDGHILLLVQRQPTRSEK